MKPADSKNLAYLRLFNQQIASSKFTGPEELVGWMGCLQAQDYAGAKWAIGCRLKGGSTDAEIERLFNEGKLLRTHLLRPTWHFVLPADIRWILKLTAPRIKKINQCQHRKLGIDESLLTLSKSLIARALEKTGRMTREDLTLALEAGKVNTAEGRISHFLMDAELDGLICSAGRQGNQFRYQLLDAVVQDTRAIGRADAIAALAKRYFESRGPATVRDFSWWSGLSLTEAKKGAEMCWGHLACEVIQGATYWFSSLQEPEEPGKRSVYLLPAFDEYAVAYADRKAALSPEHYEEAGSGLKPVIVSDGQILGTWKRSENAGGVSMETCLFHPVDRPSEEAIASACERYCEFAGKRLLKIVDRSPGSSTS